MTPKPLPPEKLCRQCPADSLPFETTVELPDFDGPLGQERAAQSLELGTALRSPGFNVYALGPPGVGKRTLVSRVVARRAAEQPVPPDWCYLNNFADSQKPRALKLPAGRAVAFRRDMERMVDDLRASIPAAFESEDYRTRLQVLEKQLEERRELAMRAVQSHAEQQGVAVVRTPVGLAVAPVRDGEVLEPDQFHKLPEEEQAKLQKSIAAIQNEMQSVLRGMPQIEREHREKVKDLNREVALFAVGHLLDDLRGPYVDEPQVLAHLDAVKQDVVENVRDFLGTAEAEDTAAQIRKLFTETPALRRYGVNVLVDHDGAQGAPIVWEDLPTHPNLMGRIEHHAHFGTLVTDFTLVRPGALHRANGGYLILDVRRLLAQPFAWEDLKRALRAGEIRIEPPERTYGLSGGASLEPESIPLSVKVVLVGDRRLYHMLAELDPEFLQQFKVAADFEDAIPRQGNDLAYARLLGTLARAEGLRPLSRDAVARVIEHGSRLAGDGDKLSSDVEAVLDVLREADHRAVAGGHQVTGREEVQAAIEAQIWRHGRFQDRVLEEIARGTLLIDTQGEKVGQVNGLSVVQLGRFAFGRPSRITARVRLGKGEVVDIEREVELGGPIHSKGVLILAGLLGARYAEDRPFTLSASLVFEQSYGGIEGDSASSAEMYALLSALSGVAVRQGIAATGSVNQLGQVQAIGGVNEKIEGFFEVCRARGLTGDQGVIIPSANVKHLMLRGEVVAACSDGRFHVWAVDDIDQGIEILTGLTAGERGSDGRFPEGSLNARVAARLEQLAERARAFASPPERSGRPVAPPLPKESVP